MPILKSWLLPTIALAAFVAVVSPLRAAMEQRVHGPIESVSGNGMVVDDRTGIRFDVQLASKLTVLVARPADQTLLSMGRGVAVVASQALDGSLQARQVLAVTEAMAQARDSGVTWDVPPGQTLVTGRIIGRTERDGMLQQLTVSGWDGTKVVFLSPKTPVATLQPASRGDLKAGETVFLAGPLMPDGSVTADRIVLHDRTQGAGT
ncbi:DUF5666 domain-containing protein [Rhodopila sp.]|jgi:hypothetical protein|uniref:DUF5666 domain-containing protein n=1 Tax=Rhodopila sp. TaxID=2480087 RepID=UPI002B5F1817|nr:DUF5666 domain-containing protein [Rhodopila sp.]HVZ09206.1 DUF5666 domain-containing protein [Rhodopila sp.]